jgi:undecaprenyl-diphosphatase
MGTLNSNSKTSEQIAMPASHAMAWANMRNLIWLLLCVTVLRLFYTAVLAPIQLVKDEAHYWEWSRHLAGSYYTKGPGVAWLIASSVRVFGNSEWAVRLPAIVMSAMTAWVIARLACDVSRNDPRAGFFAGIAFLLVPAFQFTSMLMTIDGPYIFFWMLSVWAMWHWGERLKQGQSLWIPSIGVGLFLGIGGLFKYTAWLLIPGLIAYLWLCRKQFKCNGKVLCAVALGTLVFIVTCSPLVIWNVQHDWPTVSHLLGRLHLPGGDEAVSSKWSLWYLPLFVGTQLGVVCRDDSGGDVCMPR